MSRAGRRNRQHRELVLGEPTTTVPQVPRPTYPLAARFARNMAELRRRRRWSAAQLSEAVNTLVGTALLPRSVIANLETNRRAIVTVDEAYAIAAVFDVPLDKLIGDLDPECTACKDQPPDGFACLACGRQSVPIVPAKEPP